MENFARRVAFVNGGSENSNFSISYNSKYCSICSKYIIYIYKLPEFTLVESISFDNKVFIMAKLSKYDEEIIAYITNNYYLYFYDIQSQQFTNGSLVNIEKNPICINFTEDGKYLCLFTTLIGTMYFISVYSENIHEVLIPLMKRVIEFQTCKFDKDSYILCFSDGTVTHINTNDPRGRVSNVIDEVILLKADTLNYNNYLAITKKLKWAIIYIDEHEVTLVSKASDTTKQTIAGDWIPCLPGQIVTGDADNGFIYFWSVSSGTLIDSVDLCGPGITNINVFNDSCIAAHFKNGMVVVYNVMEKTKATVVNSGHSSTIFKAMFMPSNSSVLVSASYDGTICFWDVPSLNLIDSINIKDSEYGKLTCFELSPGGSYILSGFDEGTFQITNTQTKQNIFSNKLHKGSVVGVSWSQYKSKFIATTGTDSYCYIYDIEKNNIFNQILFKKQIGKCVFSPFSNNICVTCSNGDIYLRLKGSTYIIIHSDNSPLLDVQWSPFDQNLIAATNDNGDLIIFNIENRTYRKSKGHEGAATSVLWNTELQNIIITGGADGNIIIWNVKNLSIIIKIKAHVSPISSLCSNPDKPFLISTLSKDGTISLWSIEKMFSELLLHVFQEEKRIISESVCPFNGSEMIVKLIHRIKKSDPPPSFKDTDILHINDVKTYAKKKAQKMVAKIPLDHKILERAKKSRQTVYEAADLYLKNGMYKKYCELMFILGEYDKALAAAPNVSYSFWQSLALTRSKLENEDSGLWAIISNNIDEAIDDLINTKDFDAAFLIVSALRNKNFEPESKSIFLKSKKKKFPFLSSFEDLSQFKGYEILSDHVKKYLKEGNPILASAVLLSFGDYETAIWILLYSGEYLWAADIAKQFDYDDLQFWIKICRRLIVNVLYDEAFTIAPVEIKEILAISLPLKSEEERNDFFKRHGMKTIDMYIKNSNHMSGVYKAVNLLVAGRVNEGILTLEDIAKPLLAEKNYDFTKLNEIVTVMEQTTNPNPLIIALSFYVACYKAMWLNFTTILPALAQSFFKQVSNYKLDFLSPRIEEVAFIMSLCQQKKSAGSIRLKKKSTILSTFNGGRTVKPLTSSIKTADISTEKCAICKGKDSKPEFVLEDGKSYFSMSEALSWFSVTPFSPLETHAKFFPV